MNELWVGFKTGVGSGNAVHINKALRLAKQGNSQGAYIHAELADNGLKMASEHMSAMEYEAFRTVVMQRLETVGRKR